MNDGGPNQEMCEAGGPSSQPRGHDVSQPRHSFMMKRPRLIDQEGVVDKEQQQLSDDIANIEPRQIGHEPSPLEQILPRKSINRTSFGAGFDRQQMATD